MELGYEDTNPADGQAVRVMVSTYTLTRLIGCEPVTVGDDETQPTAGYGRIGMGAAAIRASPNFTSF